MQKDFSFTAAELLAGGGVASAVYGILAEQGKPIGIGLVLIFGAGVFAMLYLGSRRTSENSNRPEE